jgi:hypothetical protein
MICQDIARFALQEPFTISHWSRGMSDSLHGNPKSIEQTTHPHQAPRMTVASREGEALM